MSDAAAPQTADDGLDRLLEQGRWTHEPVRAERTAEGLRVTAAEGSDAWRVTSYGFVHDSAHALVLPLPASGAVETTFLLDYQGTFDQAGLFLAASDEVWIKAGVEISDGPQLGAVVTRGESDWSMAPVPGWAGRLVTIRASRDGDAVTVRARAGDEPFRLVRVAPLDPAADVAAGLYCAAPTRAGLAVTFTAFRSGAADTALH